MHRNFQAIGVIAVAVLAITGFAAPAADAAQFHSSVEATTLNGEQLSESTLAFSAGSVKCKKATFSGTSAAKTTTTMTLSPSYSECTAYGFFSAPIDMNGCTYQYHIALPQDYMDIVCPAGKVIEITAANCTTTIFPQTSLTGWAATIIGNTPRRFIKFALNLAGIGYTQHSKSFPGCTNGKFSNGTYQVEITVAGYSGGGVQADLWYE